MKMFIHHCVFIGIFLNILNSVICEDCKIYKTNEVGKCVNISLCKKAKDDLRANGSRPDICGFDKLFPLVCCPLDSTSDDDEERISVRRCKELYDINFKQQLQTSILNNKGEEQTFHITIVGGKLTEVGEFPFMAAIGWPNFDNQIEFKCGGFLVEKNYVVTAAHCSSLSGAAPTVVRIGGNPLNQSNSIDIPIEEIFTHPNYRNDQTYYDIAVFKLKQNSTEVPACLWQFDDILAYKNGTAIGYGHTQFAGKSSNDLMKVKLNFYKNNECDQYFKPQSEYPQGLLNSQLCAGDPDGAMDTCQGDSGGPILIKTEFNWPYVMGVTSFGSGCAGQAPSIYTRISSYLDWIESIVWE